MTDLKHLLLKPRLRLDEATLLFDVSPRTVQRLMDEGKIEFTRLPSGQWGALTESVKTYREKKQLHDSQLVS